MGAALKGFAKFKVPGGKLVEVKLKYNESIESIQILGDFFLYPEDALNDIEKSLLDLNIGESEDKIAKLVDELAKRKSITMIGITPSAIAKAIKMAVGK